MDDSCRVQTLVDRVPKQVLEHVEEDQVQLVDAGALHAVVPHRRHDQLLEEVLLLRVLLVICVTMGITQHLLLAVGHLVVYVFHTSRKANTEKRIFGRTDA